jgi:predicted transcriptional regulator of viral defense system
MADPMGALLEVAVPQHGLFRVEQAQDVGVDDVRVRKLAARGVLERRAQGVYRVVAIPIDAYAELMEAVLWAKGRGIIAGETALALWDLADVNPRKIHLVVPPDYNPRGQGGERYQVHRRRLNAADQDEVQGVPTVTPAIAIRQAIAHGLAGDLVEQAITRAQAREHIGTETAARLRVALYDRNATPRAGKDKR